MGNTYRLAEVLSDSSVKPFLDSQWVPAVLELRNTDRLSLRKEVFHGEMGDEAMQTLRGIHQMLVANAGPITKDFVSEAKDYDWEIPEWATLAGSGSLGPVIEELFEVGPLGESKGNGLTKSEVHALVNSACRILRHSHLYHRPHSRAHTYYVRPWPEGLKAKDLIFSRSRAETVWATEEQVPDEPTVVRFKSLDKIAPPNPKEPKDFVRWAGAVKGVVDWMETQNERLRKENDELVALLDELTTSEWEEAAAEIEGIFKKENGNGELDEGDTAQATG